ncbi:pilus assembly protein N-terminal domain-containing protein [Pendulispora albinea]|uniref:Type II and III secretion system protein n=1 Tax=Pendulispora albinea TaxID=2741071 RepID=A0ABZ2LSG0_9BACT
MRLAHHAAVAVVLAAALTTTISVPSFAQRGKPAASSDDHANDEIILAVGETKTLPTKDVANYSVGVEGIIAVSLTGDKSQFVIAGKKAGSTTLLLIKNDQSQITIPITVTARSLATVEKELQQALEGTPGVKLRRVGSRFFIEGGVTTEGELRRIAQIASAYPGQVDNLVVVGQGGTDRKLLVRLDFFFVQYEKTSSYAVGLGWPTSVGGFGPDGTTPVFQSRIDYDLISGSTTAAQASIVNQPLPRLDIGSQHGWVKILKQSTVISANGTEATFQSGGEVNVIGSAGLTSQLQKITFGTNVSVLPRYDAQSKEVEVRLDSDISDLTPPGQGTTLPGRQTTKLATSVNLKLGQALVLSGIRTRNQRHSVAGLPGLSSIPVLGILFGSHQDEQRDQEGAIFIIPSIIETVPKSAVEVIKNALTAYEDFSGEVDRADSYNKTPPSAK